METASEVMTETLRNKYLNLTEIKHVISSAVAAVITEEINGMGSYKSGTRSQKARLTPPLFTHGLDEYKGV